MIDIGERRVDLVADKKFLNTGHRASELEVLTYEQGEASHGVPDQVEYQLNCESGAYIHSIPIIDKSYNS